MESKNHVLFPPRKLRNYHNNLRHPACCPDVLSHENRNALKTQPRRVRCNTVFIALLPWQKFRSGSPTRATDHRGMYQVVRHLASA
ncbi:hypothetical protein VFPPC_16444 [Pochonia chlamydosporia 170]|uniref:Uncharacterized protein n=1 Tax=Pochonia chlamydosporia 170 TaxID=1380566 RepID=A0A179FDP0_METCM|nr:hypothetical protein VFPPC_16444 [Pochonia chlamydosporia 170]OAQ63229.1 hypothetical protein VFPPC_16444 [Pochonia chlamydosporia 170]